jgi:glycosyltransferase involved in cell wall biosynthesis
MPRPLVTIVSPTHNQERFVASCAESALQQTYPDWEQVFVDDGSSDRTLAILEQYHDPRIRVIALPHAGLGSLARSYNAALAASNGSLVAILEGDDQWPADKLEVQLRSFESPDTVLSWGRADLVDDAGNRVGQMVSPPAAGGALRITTAAAFHRLTRSNFLVPTVTVMIRRTVLDSLGGFRQTGSSMLVDLPTWLWVTATHEGHVEFVDHRLGIYRVHAAQTSRQRRAAMTREHFAVVRAVEAEVGDEALRRVGWTAASRRLAESRAQLAEGQTGLQERDFRSARVAFVSAWRKRAGVADAVLALAGVLSSVARVDLVASAFAMRAWISRVRQVGRTRANRA